MGYACKLSNSREKIKQPEFIYGIYRYGDTFNVNYEITESGTYLAIALGRPADITIPTGYIYKEKYTSSWERTIACTIATLSIGDTINFTGRMSPTYSIFKLFPPQISNAYTTTSAAANGGGGLTSIENINLTNDYKYLIVSGTSNTENGSSSAAKVSISGRNVYFINDNYNNSNGSGCYYIENENPISYSQFCKSKSSWDTSGIIIIQFI